MKSSLLVCCIALALMSGASVSAKEQIADASAKQKAQSSEVPVPTLKANARAVLLDLVVTDKAGAPVSDLKRDEVTIVEGGKKQEVSSFELVDTKKIHQSADQKLPPGVFSNRTQAAIQGGTLTILVLDALNTPTKDQAYARTEMLKYLRSQKSGQPMAIYGLTTSLLVLQDFTADPELLRKAIDKRGVGGASPLLPDANANTELPGLSDATMQNLDRFEEEQTAMQTDIRVQLTLQALKAIGRAVAGYPGRKKLLWVSGAFPLSLEPGEQSGFNSQRAYGQDLSEAAALLEDAQVSVYPIDAQGLVGSLLGDASFSGRDRSGRMMTGAQLGAQVRRQNTSLSSAHDTMRQVAEETGGLAFYGRNDLDAAVEKSVGDGGTYYAVSYVPADKNWDGRFRKIEVKLNRPGTHVRYRHGYFAVNPKEVAKQDPKIVERELLTAIGSPLVSTGLSLYGSAQPLAETAATAPAAGAAEKPVSNGKRKVEVRFLLEPDKIAFEAAADNRVHCNIEFIVGVFSGNKMVGHIDQTLDTSLKPETYAKMMKDGIIFRTSVEVPEGKVRLRLLARDNTNGFMGSLDISYPPALVAAK